MQIKQRFPLSEGFAASLGILDSVATPDLIKDSSSVANVALHIPILCLKISWPGCIDVSLSTKYILDFGYYLRNIKDCLDNSKFGLLYDLMTRFTVLPLSTVSLERIFSLVNHIQTKTNSLKMRLLRKTC